MKNYIKHHPWEIIEEGFNTEFNRVSESLFSIGNGKFGQRGNFEETFTGDSLVGNYVHVPPPTGAHLLVRIQ